MMYYTKPPKRYIIGSTAEYYAWLEEIINLTQKENDNLE